MTARSAPELCCEWRTLDALPGAGVVSAGSVSFDEVPGHGTLVGGAHLSAVHAAWTEYRRVRELRALLASIKRHQHGFHVLAGDFNTIAPGDIFDRMKLPHRLRALVWLSGGQIRWRTVRIVLDAGYADVYRDRHEGAISGFTFPTWSPHVRLDYVFVPTAFRERVTSCEVFTHDAAPAASDHYPPVAEWA